MSSAGWPVPVVIAHRGASAYLPEHTLAAKALAVGLGADFVEQDIVATRDHNLIVLHDIHLDTVTDVARRFPGRVRDDGRFYAADFDLAEIQQLEVHERRIAGSDERQYPARFPAIQGEFRIPTLRAELDLVAGLRTSMQRKIGIYPEIKRPRWHLEQGIDITALVLAELFENGYQGVDDPIYLQCFDSAELVRVRHDLGCQLPLIQLLGDNSWVESPDDYEAMQTASGLAKVAETCDGIGPWIEQLIDRSAPLGHSGRLAPTALPERARDADLLVHPYTARADDLPAGFDSLEQLYDWLLQSCRIDGLFTDFPDRLRRFLSEFASNQ